MTSHLHIDGGEKTVGDIELPFPFATSSPPFVHRPTNQNHRHNRRTRRKSRPKYLTLKREQGALLPIGNSDPHLPGVSGEEEFVAAVDDVSVAVDEVLKEVVVLPHLDQHTVVVVVLDRNL